jgi:hypothetical protein
MCCHDDVHEQHDILSLKIGLQNVEKYFDHRKFVVWGLPEPEQTLRTMFSKHFSIVICPNGVTYLKSALKTRSETLFALPKSSFGGHKMHSERFVPHS